MRIITEAQESEGMESLMGEVVTLFCAVYIYTGKLVGVDDKDVKLEDPSIIYETGAFHEPNWKDKQKLPHKYWYVKVASIESYGRMK